VSINKYFYVLNLNVNLSKAYETFLDWNDDPEIAEAAERLYSHIDNLELYVGLQAEQVKPVVDGAGLCPGMSQSLVISGLRLILSL
jgi:linoleate 10R-lipoxygenase